MTIAHTQMDATSSPSITAFTTGCADQNKPQIDRSAEVSGSTDCATSVGFMKASFRRQSRDRTGPPLRQVKRQDARHHKGAPHNISKSREIRAVHLRLPTDSAPNLSKLGRLTGVSSSDRPDCG